MTPIFRSIGAEILATGRHVLVMVGDFWLTGGLIWATGKHVPMTVGDFLLTMMQS
jgi:hypothetical protein